MTIAKISHCLWFDDQAESAVNFYTSIFKHSKINKVIRYGEEGFEIHKKPAGSVMLIDFELEGQNYTALNGGPDFKFNEAFSIIINCDTQKEIDYYWEKLTLGGEEIQCGWLKDKYGLVWQVVPKILSQMLSDPDYKKSQRVTKAFLQMKKFDIETLKKAYAGDLVT